MGSREPHDEKSEEAKRYTWRQISGAGRVCAILTIAVAATPIVSAWGFDTPLTEQLAFLGYLFAVCLPFYVLHRYRSNAKEDGFKGAVGIATWEIDRTLRDLKERVIAMKDNLKGYRSYLQEFEQKEREESLRSYKEEIRGRGDYEGLLESYKEEQAWEDEMMGSLAIEYQSEIGQLSAIVGVTESLRRRLAVLHSRSL